MEDFTSMTQEELEKALEKAKKENSI